MGTTSCATMGLLLAASDTLQPLVPGGLPAERAREAPRVEPLPRGAAPFHLHALYADPNDLSAQRWGVIAPPGKVGDEALAAIEPLIRFRKEEQGAEVRIYRDAPEGASARDALCWKNKFFQATTTPDRPRYLLILGDADLLSFQLQQVLGVECFVGRLHAANADGYANYARKVLRWASTQKPGARARALFVAPDDGTLATAQGRELLVAPCAAKAGKELLGKDVTEATMLDAPESVQDLLTSALRTDPAVLLSLSHGLGPGLKGWSSREEQRARQGALLLGATGSKDRLLTEERVRSGPFLPGGLWLCVACFGAGVPARSEFSAWLAQLQATPRASPEVGRILASIRDSGELPFVAALPQAALANPEGPLAFIGHVDLAWTFAYVDPEQPNVSRVDDLFEVLRAVTKGSRAGVAVSALTNRFCAVNNLLTQLQQDAADGASGTAPGDAEHLALTFMQRNDLRGYVLLGDPAVRLP